MANWGVMEKKYTSIEDCGNILYNCGHRECVKFKYILDLYVL